MRRRKPQSGKAKKEQLQAKRAARKDDSPSNATEQSSSKSPVYQSAIVQRHAKLRGKPGASFTLEQLQRAEQRRIARTALESRFIKLSQAYIDHYRSTLAKRPFTRPISPQVATLNEYAESAAAQDAGLLLCPKRPKWKYYMLKKEVEKNESVMFEKWLSDTEERLTVEEAKSEYRVMGYFERNLDVWRQLWRVTEASEILLVLLDVRCPLLHFPPSLQDYISTLKPRKKCILVLTKVDLVPSALADSWKEYLEKRFKYGVILVESYKERDKGANTQGTRKRFDPGASPSVRKDLVAAVKTAHTELCTPPETMKLENRSRWRPRLKSQVNWQDLIDITESTSVAQNVKGNSASAAKRPENEDDESLHDSQMSKADIKKMRRFQRQKAMDNKAQRQKVSAAAAAATATESDGESTKDGSDRRFTDDQDSAVTLAQESDDEKGDDDETLNSNIDRYEPPPYLSIGLIGQPNVGKSSLLNALLGRKVVRASRTPGKTKALQTIYWSKEVRLVDCPGLVFPSFVGMEKQVMAGVIPIQNVESVIYEIGERMPLERILDLRMPDELLDDNLGEVWSTDTLLGSLAIERGFMTAKAARPDVYRAGSMIIRAFNSSQIAWSFRADIEPVPNVDQEGIWLPRIQTESGKYIGQNVAELNVAEEGEEVGTTTMGETTALDDDDDDSEGEEEESDIEDRDSENESESRNLEDKSAETGKATQGKGGRGTGMQGAFALLSTEDPEGSEEEEEEEEDDS